MLLAKLALAFIVFVTSYHVTSGLNCPPVYRAITNHSACSPNSPKFVSGGVTAEEREIILEEHNNYRANVDPPACNMRKLHWDADLAYTAQKRANMCKTTHDKAINRMIPGKFTVGQNLIINSPDWKHTIKAWHEEVHKFTYNKTPKNYFEIGHYTQIVWASTYAIGCGLALCNGVPIGICNYGPGGNLVTMLKTPYRSCAQRAPLIDCKGKVCKSRGDMEDGTCKCRCPPRAQIYGPECDVNCSVKDEAFCNKWSSDYCITSYKSSFACPWKCKTCPFVDAFYNGTAGTLKSWNLFLLQMFSLLMLAIL